jgi:signal peptidase II
MRYRAIHYSDKVYPFKAEHTSKLTDRLVLYDSISRYDADKNDAAVIKPRKVNKLKKLKLHEYIIYPAIILLGIGVDQLTKLLAVKYLKPIDDFPIIKDVFHFTFTTNDGMAWGMLDEHRWIFMTVSVFAIFALIYYFYKNKPESKLAVVSIALIVGGGVGNMIDRLFYGEGFGNGTVVDFLDFCAFPDLWYWIFNVADAFVCVGAAILFVYLFIDIIKEEKAKKSKNSDACD